MSNKQKNIKVQILETVQIGLKPIKSEEIELEKSTCFQTFMQKIKQKFEMFTPINFFMYLPLMNGTEINQENFEEYLQNLQTDPRFRKVGIQKTEFNFERNEFVRKDEQLNKGKGFSKKRAEEESDKWLNMKIQGNPSQTTLALSVEDLTPFESLNIVTKTPPKINQMSKLKEKVKKVIVKYLTTY